MSHGKLELDVSFLMISGDIFKCKKKKKTFNNQAMGHSSRYWNITKLDSMEFLKLFLNNLFLILFILYYHAHVWFTVLFV